MTPQRLSISRTAGPLGRAFGFSLTLWRFSLSVNAGWYVLFLNWRGFGFVHVSRAPWHVEWYLVSTERAA